MKKTDMKDDVMGRLIVSRMSGTINADDDAVLDRWIEEAEENKAVYDEYVAIDRRFRSTGEHSVEDALKKVHERAGIGKSGKKTISMTVAAVFVLLCISGAMIWQKEDNESWKHRITNVDNSAMHYVLPDGSDVWLRPGSEISYNEDFNVSDRTVTLDGEAYFDVISDPGCPFYVVADDFKVKVLGTVFNVRNCRDSNVEVLLAKGSVSMQTLSGQNLFCLKPGQKAVYQAQLQSFDISEIPVENILLLKYGIISLTNASVDEIVASIEQELGVKVSYDGEADPRKRYNFNFQSGSSPESVVELLGFICTGLTFNIQK